MFSKCFRKVVENTVYMSEKEICSLNKCSSALYFSIPDLLTIYRNK